MINCGVHLTADSHSRLRGRFACAATILLLAAGFAKAQLADPSRPVNGAASVITLTGSVSVLRDESPWALSVGDSIQPRQIVITGPDGSAVFRVGDGSTFQVFPNSRVIFRNNRGDWRDLLEILIGKVKVEIEKIGGQPNPNKVRTPTAVISVRGTVFDVDVEDEDATTMVMVEEGQVEVRHLLKAGDAKVLNPGEWVRVYKNQPLTARSIDRGAAFQRAVRAASDALYEIVWRNSRVPSGGTGTGTLGGTTGGSPGDSCKPNCPPPPPPPPH